MGGGKDRKIDVSCCYNLSGYFLAMKKKEILLVIYHLLQSVSLQYATNKSDHFRSWWSIIKYRFQVERKSIHGVGY